MVSNEIHLKEVALVALLLLGTLTVCSREPGSSDAEPNFALINCRLIDGTGASPIPNAVLVISDGIIADVGPADAIVIPGDANVVDVDGATVLPGFFNTHVHHGFDEDNLKAWARGGVTTVRDLAGPSLFDWKREIAEDPQCALLLAAGPMVSVPNGYPQVPWGSPHMLAVTSAEDARTKVIQLIEDGADIIKLAIESGESFNRQIPTLSPDEAAAAVDAAHELGITVSAHVLVSSDLGLALAAGVDDIAHMVTDYLPDSLINRMVQESILWVPTLELWHNVGYGLNDAAIHNLRKFTLAGGQVAIGTDYDGYSGPFQIGMPILEMEWMMEAGMSPMEIIVAGTRNAARACNRLADLGTLEEGKTADVLVINSDPLQDIHNLTDVRLVIHRGIVIRDTGS